MLFWRSQRIRSPRWLVAAALSAAVTSTKPQETAPNSQAEPSQKKSTPPNANRSSGERGLGGEALLSEKRPLPPVIPQNVSSGGSAREGASLQRSPLPRITTPSLPPHKAWGLDRTRRRTGRKRRSRCCRRGERQCGRAFSHRAQRAALPACRGQTKALKD